MGNVNMEADQIHVRDNSQKTWRTVADALKALEASGEGVAEDITELYTRDASRANKDDIANEFSAEQAYYTGDFVYYQGSLFKFIANHAAGAWNPENVAPEQIGQDIVTLKSGLTNVQNDVKLNTQDLTTPSRSINLMTLPITITKSGSSTGTVTNNDGVITLNGEFLNEEVITITCADCIAPNDAIIAYMNNVELTKANISFYNGSTKHDYFSFSIPNRIIYTSALANVVGKTINRYDITFTATTTLDNFTFSLMMAHNGQNVSTYTPNIPSVESRIEAVESVIDRLVCTEIVYDDSASLFTLPSGVPKPKDGAQIMVCGRNRSTGAIYALWFDNSASGFKIGKILDGSAPADGISISVQYIA